MFNDRARFCFRGRAHMFAHSPRAAQASRCKSGSCRRGPGCAGRELAWALWPQGLAGPGLAEGQASCLGIAPQPNTPGVGAHRWTSIISDWGVRVPCPFHCSLGNAVRHCSGEKGWLPAELFNCTTVSFLELKAMVGPCLRDPRACGVGGWLGRGWVAEGPRGQGLGRLRNIAHICSGCPPQGAAAFPPRQDRPCIWIWKHGVPHILAPLPPSLPFVTTGFSLASSVASLSSTLRPGSPARLVP